MTLGLHPVYTISPCAIFFIETIYLDYGGAGHLEADLAYGGIDPYIYDPGYPDPHYPDSPYIPPYFPEGKTKMFLPPISAVVVIESVLSVCLLF